MPLKSDRMEYRDGANYAGPHNWWGSPVGSRSILRGRNVSRGAVPTPIVQGDLMWYCGFPFPSDLVFINDAHSRYPHRGVFT